VTEVLLGGLAATLVTLVVTFAVEERRRRGDVAVGVVEWLQETYRWLEVRLGQLKFLHTGRDELVRPDDAQAANHELRHRMLEDALRARMVVAFGEGNELQLLNTFEAMLRRIVRNAWEIRDADAWKTFDVESKPFIEKMDDMRHQLEELMLRRARLPWLLRWL
jgi:hypothetical protein